MWNYGSLPGDWTVKKIGEYASIITDYVANGSFASLAQNVKYKSTPDYAVLIRLTDYNNGFNGNFVYIDKHAYEFLAKSKLFGGEIIISNVGANVGTVFRCPFLDTNMSLAPNAIMLKTQGNDNFYYYWFLSRNGQHSLKSIVTGSAQPKFNKTNFRDLLVPVPPRAVQNKIADYLSNIDKKIELNKQINENLLQQAVAIYKAWFYERSAENESAPWPSTTIGDITSLVARGITPKYNEGADQIVINQKCIRNHLVDLALARRHLPKAITEKWLIQGDLLINSTGEGTLGRTAQIWFDPNNLTVDSHVTIVRPKSVILRNYVGLWGLTHEAEIESLHTGSTGQTELPRERVKAMELPLPDESTLSRFNGLITPMTQAIVRNQQENARLAELRDSLLPRLMSGELDVSDLNL
ncbi:MAG: restriction endonuclease subunit S [Lachnospiraceae bacterium]|nr:restriction endonuclease subunit S [Lachnospiraceae bacterium]